MKPVLVLFATREGYTRRIADHVAAVIRGRADEVDVVDVAHPPATFDLCHYAGAVIAASLHLGRHEREMVAFVRAHRAELERMPTAFLSVSLAEAGVEDATAPFDQRAKAAEDVKRTVDLFCAQTGFHPLRVWPVAGALRYSQYGVITKMVMRMIARRAGGSTDTSRDHEYTDWNSLDRFVATMAAEIEEAAA